MASCDLLWLSICLHAIVSIKIAVSHDGQIQYVPITDRQVVTQAELEAAAHSAVTGEPPLFALFWYEGKVMASSDGRSSICISLSMMLSGLC